MLEVKIWLLSYCLESCLAEASLNVKQMLDLSIGHFAIVIHLFWLLPCSEYVGSLCHCLTASMLKTAGCSGQLKVGATIYNKSFKCAKHLSNQKIDLISKITPV